MSHLILLYHIFSGNGFPHIAPRGTANNLQMHKAKHRPTLMPIWQHTDIMVLKTSVKSIRTPDPQKKNLANLREKKLKYLSLWWDWLLKNVGVKKTKTRMAHVSHSGWQIQNTWQKVFKEAVSRDVLEFFYFTNQTHLGP